jgi:hypothetical protein
MYQTHWRLVPRQMSPVWHQNRLVAIENAGACHTPWPKRGRFVAESRRFVAGLRPIRGMSRPQLPTLTIIEHIERRFLCMKTGISTPQNSPNATPPGGGCEEIRGIIPVFDRKTAMVLSSYQISRICRTPFRASVKTSMLDLYRKFMLRPQTWFGNRSGGHGIGVYGGRDFDPQLEELNHDSH